MGNASPGEREGSIWVVLASLGLLFVLALPALTGGSYALDDLGAFHAPLRSFYADCLARGYGFDWIPSLFGGCYVTGEGQLGSYHPFHLLIYRFLPASTAFHLEILTSYPFLFVGMYLLLRRLVTRRDAASFGAMTFTFSSFTLLHIIHPNAIAVLSHIPWILLCIYHLGKTSIRSTSMEAGIALLTASQILLGYPQYVWFSVLAETTWAIYVLRNDGQAWLRLGIMKGLGLLIGAIQILPTWEALRDSARNQPGLEFLMEGSWHPINLFQLVNPYLFPQGGLGFFHHEVGMYLGVIPMVLGMWSIFSRLRDDAARGLIRFLTIGLLLALLLAFGKFGPFAYLQALLPIAGSFRVPARTLVLVHLLWAGLAALGWETLMRKPAVDAHHRPDRICLGLGLLGITLSLLLPSLIAPFLPPDAGTTLSRRLAGPLLFLVGGLLFRARFRGAGWAVPALILFTALDIGWYGMARTLPSALSGESVPLLADAPMHTPGERVVATPRTFGRGNLFGLGNRFLSSGFSQIDGYAALIPPNRLFGEAASVPALRAAGVAWIPAIASPTQPELLLRVSENWYKVPDPAPRIRLVTNAVPSLRPDRDILKIDPLTTVLTERRIDLEPGPPGTATLLAESPGILAIRTAASSTQLLAIADRFHAGWQATIDGHAADPLRINGDFLGLIVPSGTHRISLEFRPSSLIWGRNISLFGVALLAVMLVWRPSNRSDQPVVASETPVDDPGSPPSSDTNAPPSQCPALRLFTGAGILFICLAAVFYRITDLSTVPGINGDEAWYGIQMGEILAGHAPAWRTPTGNLINPFHSGPLLVLLAIFRPAFWILRVPSLTASLLFILLAFVLLRRRFGLWAGIGGALLAAANPQLIGYARFGWDASQSPLFCALALFWTLERRYAQALIVLLISLLVHPTNLFLLPVIVVPLLCGLLEKRGITTRQAFVTSIALMGSAVLGAWVARESGWQPGAKLGMAITHLTTPGEWAAFATLFGRLFSGATLIEYVAGPIGKTPLIWFDIASWLCLGIFGIAGVREFTQRNDRTAIHVMLGLGWAIFGFFLVAGSTGLKPHWERYAQFLMAPVLMMAAAAVGTPSAHDRKATVLFALLLGIATTQLTCVHHLYWKQLTQHGSASHRAFRSGPSEPKQWAFDLVRTAAGSLPAVIVAEDWWCGMPLRYLAQGAPEITVEDGPANEVLADVVERLNQRRFLIGFEGGPFQKLVRQLPPNRHEIHHRQIDDPDGMPILHVWSKHPLPGDDQRESRKSPE